MPIHWHHQESVNSNQISTNIDQNQPISTKSLPISLKYWANRLDADQYRLSILVYMCQYWLIHIEFSGEGRGLTPVGTQYHEKFFQLFANWGKKQLLTYKKIILYFIFLCFLCWNYLFPSSIFCFLPGANDAISSQFLHFIMFRQVKLKISGAACQPTVARRPQPC